MDDHTFPSENDSASMSPFDDKDAPPGFEQCMTMPRDYKVLIRNIKLWRDPCNPSRWLMEPMPPEIDEQDWTFVEFETEDGWSTVYHRGQIDFISPPNPLSEMNKICRGSPQEAMGSNWTPEAPGRQYRWIEDGSFVYSTGR